MRTRIFLATFFLALPMWLLFGQTATISDPSVNETGVRSSGVSVEVNTVGDTLVSTVGTDNGTAALFLDGFSGGSAVFNAILATMDASNITLSQGDTRATIVFPASSGYYISENDTANFTVPATVLKDGSGGDIVASGDVIIENSTSTISGDSGDIDPNGDEDDIRNGDVTYVLTLSGNLWKSTITSDAGLLTTVKGMFSGGTYFPSLVSDLESSDLSLNAGGNILTITFGKTPDFFIPSNEVITVTVPSSLLFAEEPLTNSTEDFTINNTTPSIFITTETFTEASIRAGTNQFTIEVNGDVWTASIDENAFDDGISTGGDWDSQVRDDLTIVRTNDSILTVTIPQKSGFDTFDEENFDVDVPSTFLQYTSSGTYTSANEKTITPKPVTISASATFNGVSEGAIRSNTYTITLTLSEDDWDSRVDTDDNVNRDLIRGITFSPVEALAATSLENAILGTDRGAAKTSKSGSNVVFTISTDPDFNIYSDVQVSLTAPASSLVNSSSSVSTGNFATINRVAPSFVLGSDPDPLYETDLNSSKLRVKLSEDTWNTSSLSATNFTLTVLPSNPGITIGSVSRRSPDSCDVNLNYSGNMSTNHTIALNIDQATLTGSDDLSSGNTVTAIAIIEPNITDVTIGNTPYGIGSTVTADITVDNDQGATQFEIVSGTIGGRTVVPASLSKVSNTLYRATFSIVEDSEPQYAGGDPIPVSNLQLFNDTTAGNIYNGTITQGLDIIDSKRPVINLVTFNTGNFKVDDKVTATVSASGEAGLSFMPGVSSINGKLFLSPDISAQEIGSGTYQVEYTIREGEPDVTSGVPINIVMFDIAGNESNAYTTADGSSPQIDANSPTILSVNETSTGSRIPGETIELLITAEETGLDLVSGTKVNNVSMEASDLTDNGDDTYTLRYVVGSNDAEVAAGALTATIILSDDAGNTVTQVNGLLNADVAIFTDTPSGFIFGSQSICIGESATIQVTCLGGSGAYNYGIREGLSGPVTAVTDTIPNATFTVTPNATIAYYLVNLSDNEGVSGIAAGEAIITVNALPSVSIVKPQFRNVFNVGEDSIQLEGDPIGGVFTGPGVETISNLFYPGVADTTNSPHTIVYTFTDPATGCTSTAQRVFEVVEDQAELNVPPVICFNEGPVTITGKNIYDENLPGQFFLQQQDGVFVNAPYLTDVDPNDNAAVIDPSQLNPGENYTVYYQYLFQGTVFQIISKTFRLEKVPELKFFRIPDEIVCSNDFTRALEGSEDNPFADYSFYGTPAVSGNVVDGFSFNPGSAITGKDTLIYKFRTELGCVDSIQHPFEVFYVPQPDFRIIDSCIVQAGGEISFENLTVDPLVVDNWTWNFGDIESAFDNEISSDIYVPSVSHDFTRPNEYDVTLTIVVETGGTAPCVSSHDQEVIIGDIPKVDFNFSNLCYLGDVPTELRNNTTSTNDFLPFKWTITNDSDVEIATISTDFATDISYIFPEQGVYKIKLLARNDVGCRDSLTKDLVFENTISFSEADSRLMTFDGGPDGWIPYESDDKLNEGIARSWKLGEPDFNGFTPQVGDGAWYTSLAGDFEDTIVNSRIQSTCYDFRGLEKPMIRMDILKSFDFNTEGAVLQYTKDNGVSWTTVGNIGNGINWYNSFNMRVRPGEGEGSSIGWTGSQLFNPDTNWVTVAYDLDELQGDTLVIFGVFYATDGASVVDNQGMAVDNIYIGERDKGALVEQFTNTEDASANSADQDVIGFIETYPLDVTSLHYHMSYPEEDPFNTVNPAPSSARSFYYGISEVPTAVMDGGFSDTYIYDFSENEPLEEDLRAVTLEEALFEMEVRFQLYSDHLSGTIDLEALKEMPLNEMVLNVAVAEKEVTTHTSETGVTLFRNVVLNMLPTAGGTVFKKSWNQGEGERVSVSWPYKGVEDFDELFLVAFLQEEATGKILQVATADSSEYPMTLGNRFTPDKLKIYPNPTSERLFIEHRVEDTFAETQVEITDLTGRTVLLQQVTPDQFVVEVDVSTLLEGSYVVRWIENQAVMAREVFVKSR